MGGELGGVSSRYGRGGGGVSGLLSVCGFSGLVLRFSLVIRVRCWRERQTMRG